MAGAQVQASRQGTTVTAAASVADDALRRQGTASAAAPHAAAVAAVRKLPSAAAMSW